jgi:Bromodomain
MSVRHLWGERLERLVAGKRTCFPSSHSFSWIMVHSTPAMISAEHKQVSSCCTGTNLSGTSWTRGRKRKASEDDSKSTDIPSVRCQKLHSSYGCDDNSSPSSLEITLGKFNELICLHDDDYSSKSADINLLRQFRESLRCMSNNLSSVYQFSEQSNFSYLHHVSPVDLLSHIINLRTDNALKIMRPILVDLIQHPRNSGIFNEPVEPSLVGALDYYDKIKFPMDLGTVKKKLAAHEYNDVMEAARDIILVFRNAMVYNPSTHFIHQSAYELFQRFYNLLCNALDKNEKYVSLTICEFDLLYHIMYRH